MREVTTRINNLVHPNDVSYGAVLAFSKDMVGEIVRDTVPTFNTANNCEMETPTFHILWSNGIVSLTYNSFTDLVTSLERQGVKFYIS